MSLACLCGQQHLQEAYGAAGAVINPHPTLQRNPARHTAHHCSRQLAVTNKALWRREAQSATEAAIAQIVLWPAQMLHQPKVAQLQQAANMTGTAKRAK